MNNFETTADSSSTIESKHANPIRMASSIVWFDLTALLLASLTIVTGFYFWRSLFSSVDRSLCFGFAMSGLSVALARSNWRGHQTQLRAWFAVLMYISTAIFLCLAIALSNPLLFGIGCSTLLAGWCMVRIRGDSCWHALFLGLVLLVPYAIDGLANRGFFDWLESITIATTSSLANAVGQPNARTDQTIWFRHGIADHFSTICKWDSLVSLFGVSLFCILAFRRSLLASSIDVVLSAFVWIAVRSVAWATLTYLGNRNETWYQWSIGIEAGLFFIGVAMVVSLDQLFANILKPIPFDLFSTDSSLCSFLWNWLCGMPNLVLRLPSQHLIALNWRTLVKQKGKTPSFRTDFDWMRIGLLGFLFHPIWAVESIIDACWGWKSSRNWSRFFLHLPSAILLAAIYLKLGLYWPNRQEIQQQLCFEESVRLCSTKALELACLGKQEVQFSKAVGTSAIALQDSGQPISDRTMQYITLLNNQVNEPSNSAAKYRLAMVSFLAGQEERAEREIREIADSKLGGLPQANAWIAKEIIIRQSAGEPISKQELLNNLEQSSKWKEVDFRLLFMYARLLEEQKEYRKAIEITKLGVAAKPEFILDLAKLYVRIGDNDGRISIANQAEDYFMSRINLPSETEADRISVANARLMANRLEQAAEILTEGLRQNRGGELTVKRLSEIQQMLFRNSIRKNEMDKIEMDLTLLEAMVETDDLNPEVSSEIATLLTYKVKPTKKLIEALKKQIELGIPSVPSLLLIGAGYFNIGNLKQAQQQWEMAIAKEPDNFVGLNNLANCLLAMSATNADRAIELASKANSLSPNNADILDTWGEALLAAMRPKEAVNKLELAIHIDKNRIGTMKKLITAYEALGMNEMAKTQSEVVRSIEKFQLQPTHENNLLPADTTRKN